MDYAIISIRNNQYLVKPGDKITALGELGKVGDQVDEVKTLAIKDGSFQIGQPNIATVVTLKVVSITKTEKVDIFKYRGKSRYRRHTGHRQPQTVLEVVAAPKTAAKTKSAK